MDKTTKVVGDELEQLGRKRQGQGDRDPPKEGRTRRNRTATPQTQASTSAKGRYPVEADHRDKERQEDKVTKSYRLYPKVALRRRSFSGTHRRLRPTTLHRPRGCRKSSPTDAVATPRKGSCSNCAATAGASHRRPEAYKS